MLTDYRKVASILQHTYYLDRIHSDCYMIRDHRNTFLYTLLQKILTHMLKNTPEYVILLVHKYDYHVLKPLKLVLLYSRSWEMYEDTKVVTRSRKSKKDKQFNGQKNKLLYTKHYSEN